MISIHKQSQELKDLIAEHRKLTRRIADGSYDKSIIDWHRDSGEIIALALSDFKCEAPNCNSPQNLTIHHMIRNKNLMCVPSNKFYSQRQYFFNLAVLCFNCHSRLDREILNNPNGEKQTIEETKLRKIRRRLNMETANDKKMSELQTPPVLS